MTSSLRDAAVHQSSPTTRQWLSQSLHYCYQYTKKSDLQNHLRQVKRLTIQCSNAYLYIYIYIYDLSTEPYPITKRTTLSAIHDSTKDLLVHCVQCLKFPHLLYGVHNKNLQNNHNSNIDRFLGELSAKIKAK